MHHYRDSGLVQRPEPVIPEIPVDFRVAAELAVHALQSVVTISGISGH